jgi:hypothetical protein
VNGVEVVNGSSATPDDRGWRLWADFLNAGYRFVAVGGSDLHDPISGAAAIGRPSTVVWAEALAENAIVAGLKSGRVFVRNGSSRGSSVTLTASNGNETAAMGQSIRAGALTLTVSLADADGAECRWFRRGELVAADTVEGNRATLSRKVEAAPRDWFSVVVVREERALLISNAVFVTP